MDSKKSITPKETDLYTADELAAQVFRCSYHTFMTEIKVLPDFPVPNRPPWPQRQTPLGQGRSD